MMTTAFRCLIILVCLLSLVGCNSDSSGSPGGTIPGKTTVVDSKDFFARNIQSSMTSCRGCHNQDRLSSYTGDNFQLSDDAQNDYAHLYAAWQVLGKGVENNAILRMNAVASARHTGGQLWPAGSQIYENVRKLLDCWNRDESNCAFSVATDVTPENRGLLDSSHAAHPWKTFCENNAADALLPPDPRKQLSANTNQGKAVHFNVYPQQLSCRVTMNSLPKMDTCGEYLAYMETAKKDFFNLEFAIDAFSIDVNNDFERLLKEWGIEFDEALSNTDIILDLIEQRYGLNAVDPNRNPFPIPGEDVNATDGGSLQLPLGLRQLTNRNGVKYTGKISANCLLCHAGVVGDESDGAPFGTMVGLSNSNVDFGVIIRDFNVLFTAASRFIGLSTTRGNTPILTITRLVAGMGLLISGDFEQAAQIWSLDSHSTGTTDPVPWWNLSHRPNNFWGGDQSHDCIDSFALGVGDVTPLTSKDDAPKHKILHMKRYVGTQLTSPVLPEKYYDKTLAEQGAVIFHSKDLWADQRQTRPKPEGNGSCAGCHGAYSPLYVNDPNYLDDPMFEGIGAYVVPAEIMGVDPNRGRGFNSQEGFPRGILAPPLYGIWASAPYLHNASVPTLRQVLRSNERPRIWARRLVDNNLTVNKGFDLGLQNYDLDKRVGWEYDELVCGDRGTVPFKDCMPGNIDLPVPSLLIAAPAFVWLADVFQQPLYEQEALDKQKIYNSYLFGNSNKGHDFSDLLTESEVTAVIEYLKTL